MTFVIPIPYNLMDYIVSFIFIGIGVVFIGSTIWYWRACNKVGEEKHYALPIIACFAGIVLLIAGISLLGSATELITFKTVYGGFRHG